MAMGEMNRRSFLQFMGAAAAVAPVLDLDKLLWVPGQKTIFVPETPKIITRCVTQWDGPIWLGVAGEPLMNGDIVRPGLFGAWQRMMPGEKHPIVGFVTEDHIVPKGQHVLIHEGHYVAAGQVRRAHHGFRGVA